MNDPTKNKDFLSDFDREIETAIDFLFVDQKKEKQRKEDEVVFNDIREEKTETKAAKPIPSSEKVETTGLGIDPSKYFESLDAHLLSLEWEIDPAVLKEIQTELELLSQTYKQDRSITSIIDTMINLVKKLIKNTDNITPDLMSFLRQSGETLKWLVKKKEESETIRDLVSLGLRTKIDFLKKEGKQSIEEAKFSPTKSTDPLEILSQAEKVIEGFINRETEFGYLFSDLKAFIRKLSKQKENLKKIIINIEKVKSKEVSVLRKWLISVYKNIEETINSIETLILNFSLENKETVVLPARSPEKSQEVGLKIAQVGDKFIAFPKKYFVKTLVIPQHLSKLLYQRGSLTYKGKTFPLTIMSKVLDVKELAQGEKMAVICNVEEKYIAIMVDKVLYDKKLKVDLKEEGKEVVLGHYSMENGKTITIIDLKYLLK